MLLKHFLNIIAIYKNKFFFFILLKFKLSKGNLIVIKNLNIIYNLINLILAKINTIQIN